MTQKDIGSRIVFAFDEQTQKRCKLLALDRQLRYPDLLKANYYRNHPDGDIGTYLKELSEQRIRLARELKPLQRPNISVPRPFSFRDSEHQKVGKITGLMTDLNISNIWIGDEDTPFALVGYSELATPYCSKIDPIIPANANVTVDHDCNKEFANNGFIVSQMRLDVTQPEPIGYACSGSIMGASWRLPLTEWDATVEVAIAVRGHVDFETYSDDFSFSTVTLHAQHTDAQGEWQDSPPAYVVPGVFECRSHDYGYDCQFFSTSQTGSHDLPMKYVFMSFPVDKGHYAGVCIRMIFIVAGNAGIFFENAVTEFWQVENYQASRPGLSLMYYMRKRT